MWSMQEIEVEVVPQRTRTVCGRCNHRLSNFDDDGARPVPYLQLEVSPVILDCAVVSVLPNASLSHQSSLCAWLVPQCCHLSVL